MEEHRASPREVARTADLMRLAANGNGRALDIGARDGHFSKLLAADYESVTALDLELPEIEHDKVTCVVGDITKLQFSDNSFDLVFCAEVLEHIPAHLLQTACDELSRVAKDKVVIGVPNRQDIRVGRMTCAQCGGKNPPYGHVNSFDDARLARLFPSMRVQETSYVAEVKPETTNALAVALMDFAGNPYGPYDQDEHCIHCDRKMEPPGARSLSQKIATRLGFWLGAMQKPFVKPRGTWIHTLLVKQQAP